MSPEIPDDCFLVFHHFIKANYLTVGKKVRVNHPTYGTIIKEITHIESIDTYWLKGLNNSSVTTLEMGPINRRMISGVLCYKIVSR